MKKLSILILFLLLLSKIAYAGVGQIDDSKAIRAILGESGPKYEEKLAIAHAIRNRGSLNGVYGYLKAPTAKQWQSGAKAWAEAESSPDSVLGAKYWLSDYDLKHCKASRTKFRLSMTETAYIGHTHFYRQIK